MLPRSAARTMEWQQNYFRTYNIRKIENRDRRFGPAITAPRRPFADRRAQLGIFLVAYLAQSTRSAANVLFESRYKVSLGAKAYV